MRLKKLSNYTMKIFLQSQPNPRQLIAFDIGAKHTGSAISCMNLKKPYKVPQIDQVKENKPTALIIGIPEKVPERQYYQYNHVKCDKSNTIAEQYKQQLIDVNYTLVDESWSTKEAASKLKEIELNYAKWGHLHNQKQLLDGMAAMNILQRYLTYYNS